MRCEEDHRRAFDPALFPWVRPLMLCGIFRRNRRRLSEAQAQEGGVACFPRTGCGLKYLTATGFASDGKGSSRRGSPVLCGCELVRVNKWREGAWHDATMPGAFPFLPYVVRAGRGCNRVMRRYAWPSRLRALVCGRTLFCQPQQIVRGASKHLRHHHQLI